MSLTAGKQLLLSSLAGYRVSRSLRFNSADSAYLSRTPGSAGNQKTYTLSIWIKRSKLGGKYIFGAYFSNLSRYQYIGFDNTDQLVFFGGTYTTGGSTSTNVYLVTTAVYRDVSAWYHLVLAVDTTQATASDRVKLFVNGVQVTAFDSSTYPAQNSESYINSVQTHYLGDWGGGASYYHDGYLANVEFVDGTALTPSSFAETDATTAQWVPKLYSGSYGSQGWKLTFADNSNNTATTLGADTSGNGNNWTPNNLSVTAGAGNDALTDSPTSYGTGTSGGDVRGNFCTWNPLDNGGLTLSNGNLEADRSSSGYLSSRSTMGVSSGKWYWECTCDTSNSGNIVGFGIATQKAGITTYLGADAFGWMYYGDGTGSKYNNGSSSSYGSSFTTNDVIGIALDLDAGTLVFYKNGVSQGTAYSGLAANTYFPALTLWGTAGGTLNTGQRAFAYTPPANHKPLVDTYLPTPTVIKPSEVFDVIRYTGNGSTQAIPNVNTVPTTLGFSPDFAWIKVRNGAVDHVLYDQIRGAQRYLSSNTTGAEGNQTGTPNVGLYAFTSDGFSVGDISGGSYGVNGSSGTYVAWAWDAGTTTVTNTQGSITSSVRANASAGFSIVSAPISSSGGSIGHGLNVSPGLIVVKNRGTSGTNWVVWHSSLGTNDYLLLNSTNAKATSVNLFNGVSSSTFTVGSGFAASTLDFICYCFAPVSGYSNAFSFVGNGSTDGPAVWLGFRPRFVILKASSSTSHWHMMDSARQTYNQMNTNLFANLSNAELSDPDFQIDFLSNGFKLRTSGPSMNGSGVTYIGYAWAENPFQYARAR